MFNFFKKNRNPNSKQESDFAWQMKPERESMADVVFEKDFVLLLISFLDGAKGAGEVLNDFFEERGQPRAVSVDSESIMKQTKLGNRLSLVLNVLLPAKFTSAMAVDFSSHAIQQSSFPRKDSKKASKVHEALLKFNKQETASFEDEKKLMESANKFLLENWKSDGSAEASAVWSVWATVMAKPGNAATAAQAVSKDELGWQVEYLKNEVLQRVKDE